MMARHAGIRVLKILDFVQIAVLVYIVARFIILMQQSGWAPL
jgi:hypothetical protein